MNLVTRLRSYGENGGGIGITIKAADRIEALEDDLEAKRRIINGASLALIAADKRRTDAFMDAAFRISMCFMGGLAILGGAIYWRLG